MNLTNRELVAYYVGLIIGALLVGVMVINYGS